MEEKKPFVYPEQLESIRNEKAWVNFVLVWNPEQGKYNKPPINPHTLRNGSTTNPKSWTTFDDAFSKIGKTATFTDKKGENHQLEISGVGIVLEAVGLVGIDFDDVITTGGGKTVVYKEAREIWQFLDSYTELSPSGSGVHILAKGKKPNKEEKICKVKIPVTLNKGKENEEKNYVDYEMYDSGRYFTFTGRTLSGCDKGLEERQERIDKVYELFKLRQEEQKEKKQKAKTSPSPVVSSSSGGSGERVVPTESDVELLEKMFNSKKGDSLRRLYDGDLSEYGGDHSRGDLALCNALAFFTNLDGERIDRMFRQSGLFREKWDRRLSSAKSETYGQYTIKEALSDKSARKEFTPEERREYGRAHYTDEERKAYAQRKEQEELARIDKKWSERRQS